MEGILIRTTDSISRDWKCCILPLGAGLASFKQFKLYLMVTARETNSRQHIIRIQRHSIYTQALRISIITSIVDGKLPKDFHQERKSGPHPRVGVSLSQNMCLRFRVNWQIMIPHAVPISGM